MPLRDYVDEITDLKPTRRVRRLRRVSWLRKPAPGWLRPALTIALCAGIYAVMRGA